MEYDSASSWEFTHTYIYILCISIICNVLDTYTYRSMQQGSEEVALKSLQRNRDSMGDVLQLQNVPEIEQDGEILEHMRIQELVTWQLHALRTIFLAPSWLHTHILRVEQFFKYMYIIVYMYLLTPKSIHPLQEGERTYAWAIQNGDAIESRCILPQWISRVLELRLCQFVTEHDAWQERILKRVDKPNPLTRKQQARYEAWQANLAPRFVFSKEHQQVVTESKRVTADCIAVQMHLDADPDKLEVSVASGQRYRLVLLAGLHSSTSLPETLDVGVPPDALNEMERTEQEDSEASPTGIVGDEEPDPDEEHAQMYKDAAYHMDFPEAEDEDFDLEVLAESGDELPEFKEPKDQAARRVKSFNHREAWNELELEGLTLVPSHIVGCFVSYHKRNQQWQAFYPGLRSKSVSWGRDTKRTELEAILHTIRYILEAHCASHPRDLLWSGQLKRVVEAESTGKF